MTKEALCKKSDTLLLCIPLTLLLGLLGTTGNLSKRTAKKTLHILPGHNKAWRSDRDTRMGWKGKEDTRICLKNTMDPTQEPKAEYSISEIYLWASTPYI